MNGSKNTKARPLIFRTTQPKHRRMTLHGCFRYVLFGDARVSFFYQIGNGSLYKMSLVATLFSNLFHALATLFFLVYLMRMYCLCLFFFFFFFL